MEKIKFKVNVGYSGYGFTFDRVSDAADFMAIAIAHIDESKAPHINLEVVLMDNDHVETDD